MMSPMTSINTQQWAERNKGGSPLSNPHIYLETIDVGSQDHREINVKTK